MDQYYSVQVIFVPKYVFRVVFEGGILGDALNFLGNPYLNSTTVLFDICMINCGKIWEGWYLVYNNGVHSTNLLY